MILFAQIQLGTSTNTEEEPKYQPLPTEPPKKKDTIHREARESSTPLLDEEMSYLDQMLSSFDSESPSFDDPSPRVLTRATSKPKLGVQVLPSGPVPTLVPQANSDNKADSKSMRPRSIPIQAPVENSPSSSPSTAPRVPVHQPTVARMSRTAVPLVASTPTPSKIPTLRTTSSLNTGFTRATINMDDLLDQVIQSIVTDETTTPAVPPPQSPQAPHSARNTLKLSYVWLITQSLLLLICLRRYKSKNILPLLLRRMMKYLAKF